MKSAPNDHRETPEEGGSLRRHTILDSRMRRYASAMGFGTLRARPSEERRQRRTRYFTTPIPHPDVKFPEEIRERQ